MLLPENSWTYTYLNFDNQNPGVIEYLPQHVEVKEEFFVNNETFRKVLFTYEGPCGIHSEEELFQEDNGKIYRYDGELGIKLLTYDFNETDSYFLQYRTEFDGLDSMLVLIDSVKMVNYPGNHLLQTQFVQTCYRSDAGIYEWCYENRIIKNIGADYFFIRDVERLCDPEDFIHELRCFNSPNVNINFLEAACDTSYTELILSNNELEAVGFKIYPNPSNDFIMIESDEIITHIELTDVTGNHVTRFEISSNIDVSNFNMGIYLVRCTFKSGEVLSRKLFVSHK